MPSEKYVVEAVIRCQDARAAERVVKLLAEHVELLGARLEVAGLYEAGVYDAPDREKEPA